MFSLSQGFGWIDALCLMSMKQQQQQQQTFINLLSLQILPRENFDIYRDFQILLT